MRKIFLFIAVLLLLPFVSAINLNIEKQDSNEIIIQGINQPAISNLKITNLGASDNLQFYNLLGFSMAPKGTVYFGQGEAKIIELMIYPKENFNYRGPYSFKYFIMGKDNSKISQELTIKIIDLKDALEIGSGEINLESNSLEIYIHNKENFNFEEINIKFNSVFFEFEETFLLEPNERKNFKVELNKEEFKKLMAGFYTLNAEVNVENKKVDLEGVIKFTEKDILTTTKKDYGLLINTQIIKKKNEGNVLASSEIVIKKNIFSRLFTTLSPEPDIVERYNSNVYYTWIREIKPGESMEIIVKTNWLFPFLIILFIIAIVVLAKQYSRTDLILRKKISFVKAKGGEFALKVSIFVNAKKHIEKVSVIDKLPSLVKIYKKFGGEEPKRINEKNKRIEWEFNELEEGETRILSYIIYSKIGIIGKFALPKATAIYEKDGKIHESESNKAFFVAEQRGKKVDE
jgi:hypothetical protein|tara:strand:- start:1494 stop:2873 length:1380 start_codon:yes stop_codon:yes gene_type:complete